MRENTWSVYSLVLIILALISNTTTTLVTEDLISGYQPLSYSDQLLLQQWSASQSEVVSSQLMRLALPNYMQKFLEVFENSKQAGTLEEFSRSFFTGVNSTDCRGHVLEWMHRLVSSDFKWITEKDKWAAQMVDAWGKLPEGILTGHLSAYGDFDECVQAKASSIDVLNRRYPEISKNFEGSYCTTYLVPGSLIAQFMRAEGNRGAQFREAESVIGLLNQILNQKLLTFPLVPSVGTCMPNSCSLGDTQRLYTNAVNMSDFAITNETIREMLPVPLVMNCAEGKKKDLDGATIFVIVLLSALFAICLGTGVVDYFLNYGVEKPPERGVLYKYVMAFSFYNNTKKWMSTRKTAEDLGCLHGIRFLSTAWVVLAHTYLTFLSGPQWNRLDVLKVWSNWTVLAVMNGTFSVDTFFVMSGMLATYNILKLLDKSKGKINIPMLYVHRIIRLTPTYAILVGIAATLTVYAGNGPNWQAMARMEQNCRNHWWANLLYINNIYKTEEPCNGESWYLANDMQFYLLSPFIVYPIWKWRRIGLAALAVLTCLSIASPVLISNFYPAPPAEIFNRPYDQGNRNQIYRRPWARIVTFLVGIWLGWILHVTKEKKLRLPWWAVTVGWLASTGTVLAVIFGIAPWFNPDNEIPKAAGLFYAGLSRFSYGVAVSWVIFACVKGYGGIVNDILSWNVFMPLGRLTFCIYLLSKQLQFIFHMRLTQPIRYDTYTVVNLFFSHMVMSSIAGFIATMVFESPFIALQRLIFEGR